MSQEETNKSMEQLSLVDEKKKTFPKPPKPQHAATSTEASAPEKFSPYDLTKAPTVSSGLPSDLWTIVQSAPASFTPSYFLDVSRNLLENPNLTASHLARAELSYTSFTDASFNPKATTPLELASIVKHLRPEHRPQLLNGGVEGYELEWTVVRKMIPRNPKLDDSMVQSCHLFTSKEDVSVKSADGSETTAKAERYMVVYLPHVDSPEAIPYYHPKVRSLAILYTYFPSHDASTSALSSPGLLSIYFDLFASHPLDNRLERTALKLLEIIHKHSRGRQAGYKKRVHHDQIIPQKTFQDTYAYLKGKYAKQLIDGWVEQTPPDKHVFEDLGIAAFLMELWVDMYGANADETPDSDADADEKKKRRAQTAFPGFVDIGCGNGLLVYILNAEGWSGWGFDARRRKTWAVFGDAYADKLKEMLLIPRVLDTSTPTSTTSSGGEEHDAPTLSSHDGVFPRGTFIVSNHADELTPWTPLLASLSSSPFIAIPCCSHDFGGTRIRAPVHAAFLPSDGSAAVKKNKQPSAYASLCSWTSHLAQAMGYVPEREHLRIPSTRNIAVVGRKGGAFEEGSGDGDGGEGRLEAAREVVVKEMGGDTSVEQVRLQWVKRGSGLMKPGAH
jgi:tRNASer (uridine44-2'-O)-methyltransferase